MQQSDDKSRKSGFYGLGIAPAILQTLEKLDFHTPTPIQQQAIPVAIDGKDMIGIAQTGTGKTLAFGIPMVQSIMKSGGQGMVLLPTRELALQVDEVLYKIGKPLGLKTAVLIGGTSIRPQIGAIRRNPHIIIATPGRLIDHLEQRTIKLDRVNILVLDEADRMLDMGFKPQIMRILQGVPKQRQTMLFSATMPQDIVRLANSYMKLPLRIEIAPSGTTVEKVTQELFFISKPDKPRLLEKLLYEYRGSVLVFSRAKLGAKRIAAGVRALGHSVTELHSNKSLNQRKEALDGFRNGKYRILVATDIAARGIDVKGIELVLNYDLPQNAEDYIHRIGRTARAGAAGHAISFATSDQRGDVRSIERLMRATLPLKSLPELPPARAGISVERGARPFRSHSNSRGGFSSRPGFRTKPGFGPKPSFRPKSGFSHGSSTRPAFRRSSR